MNVNKNSEQCMVAYAAEAQRSKPTHGGTASMQPLKIKHSLHRTSAPSAKRKASAYSGFRACLRRSKYLEVVFAIQKLGTFRPAWRCHRTGRVQQDVPHSN